jgi:hypothetical protein
MSASSSEKISFLPLSVPYRAALGLSGLETRTDGQITRAARLQALCLAELSGFVIGLLLPPDSDDTERKANLRRVSSAASSLGGNNRT